MKWGSTIAVVIGLVITIAGMVLRWYAIPNIVVNEVAENVILYNDTDQFKRFEKLPVEIDFKVYVFDILNPEEVNEGAKPIVQEKGPYLYKQTREKKDITWDDKNKISYYEYQKFTFIKKDSSELSDEDSVTILNPALTAAMQILKSTGLTFLLPMLGSTADTTFGGKNIFLKTTVREFLFQGISICDTHKINSLADKKDQVNAKLACLGLYLIPTRNIKFKDYGDGNSELFFSFLGHKHNNHDGHYTINSGIDDVKKVASIEKWEDNEYLSKWKGEKSQCNKIRGRDAVIFEPYLKETSSLPVFNTDVCRTMDLYYSKSVEFRDVTALEYHLPETTLAAINISRENEGCYCLGQTKGITQSSGCMKKGLLELFTCYNAPIVLSFPHYLWADEDYKNAVEGLSSNIDKHRTFVLLEPMTGTPLNGSKRVQFNMFVYKIDEIEFMNNFGDEDRLIPLIWLDEAFSITDELYDTLYESYISKTYLIEWLTWTIIGIGIAVIVITVIVVFILNKRQSNQLV